MDVRNDGLSSPPEPRELGGGEVEYVAVVAELGANGILCFCPTVPTGRCDDRQVDVASGGGLGIGFLTAAKILALTGNIERFPNQKHYASCASTAPIDMSSGDQETHRLSRRGNRQHNAAIHVAAITQARDPGPGRDHYRRKIAEHKTVKEARRSLKRPITNASYRRILADRQRLELQAA